MKFKNTKNLLIASTSVVLVASVAVVSTVFPDNEISVEKEAGSVKVKDISNEKSGEKNSTVDMSSAKEAKDKKGIEKEGEKKEEEIPVVNNDVEDGAVFKDSPVDKVPSNKSPESTTDSKVASTPISSIKVESSTKTPTTEKTTSKAPSKETPAPKEESKPVTQPAQQVINMTEKTYQTTESLNMRSTSSVNGTLLASIPKGTQVKSGQKQNNWFKVTYANKTGWVSSSYLQEVKPKTATSPVTEKPAPNPTPTPPPAPAPVEQKLMTRAQAEAHVTPYVSKDSNGFSLISGSGRYSIILEFPISGSGKAQMSVDGVNYISGYTIKPGDFGQEEYDGTKAHFALMNGAIQAYANTQFGVASQDANTLVAEIKQMTLYGYAGDIKKITIQGKTVTIARQGSRTNISY